MNTKVEFKLIRNLYFIVHKNYEKTSYVDSSNLVNGKFLDNDLNSLLEITSVIKAKISLTRFIKFAYQVIFPSMNIAKSISSKKVQNISSISNIYEQVMSILENNIFKDLSFVMAILVFNHYYYKKFNRFVVFYEYHKENLFEFCTNKNRFIGAIIEPGSPWENGYCESFNGKMRDEFLNSELLSTLQEAQALTSLWINHYNHVRPHSALNYQAPAPESIVIKST